MKKFNTKTFFLKSALLHLLMSVLITIVSWQFFEPFAYNFMVKNFTAQKTGSDEIVLIVIDDKSIEKHRWPWKRHLYANIFEYLIK